MRLTLVGAEGSKTLNSLSFKMAIINKWVFCADLIIFQFQDLKFSFLTSDNAFLKASVK